VGSWGFIGLAYGLAAAALVGYLFSLRARLRHATEELAVLEREPARRRG
jgi:hypothetical protein